MKLTAKLTVALTCAIMAVLGVNALVRLRREVPLHVEDVRRDSRLLGRALGDAVARIWQTVGRAEALDLLGDANERQSHVAIRWVRTDLSPGEPDAPEVPPALLRAAFAVGGEAFVRWRPPDQEVDAAYTYVPVSVPGQPGALELRESLAPEDVYVRRTVIQAVLATGTLVVLCGGLALALGMVFVGRPVKGLVAQARRIGAGDLSARVRLKQRDEIGELAAEIDAMCDRLLEARSRVESETAARLAVLDQLRHADRLTTVGKLAAGVAHEVGTPLNVITGHAQLIQEEYPPGSRGHESASVITSQADRVTSIIRQLLDFARRRTPSKVSEDLRPLLAQVAALLGSLAHKSKVHLDVVTPAEETHSQVDSGQLQQALANLVVNGIHAMPGGGTLTLGLERKLLRPPPDHGGPEGDYARIWVEDRGHGIDADVLPRVFEPFFTTKDVGEGTGLGLSVAYGIVRDHGGWIEVTSEPEQGSCFSVCLPVEPVS